MISTQAKKAKAEAKQKEQALQGDILAQAFARVLATEDGKTLISHLYKRFDVTGRVHIPDATGQIDTKRGLIRDGERAAVTYIYQTALKANPKLPHP